MAELSLTAGSVVPDDGYSYVEGVAGETVVQGQLLYLKASDSRYWKAHCETSAATAAVVGVCLTGAAAGQPVRLMTSGTITIGATVAVGTVYLLGTAALIQPHGDIATSDWMTTIGIAISTTKISLRIHVSGVQKAA